MDGQTSGLIHIMEAPQDRSIDDRSFDRNLRRFTNCHSLPEQFCWLTLAIIFFVSLHSSPCILRERTCIVCQNESCVAIAWLMNAGIDIPNCVKSTRSLWKVCSSAFALHALRKKEGDLAIQFQDPALLESLRDSWTRKASNDLCVGKDWLGNTRTCCDEGFMKTDVSPGRSSAVIAHQPMTWVGVAELGVAIEGHTTGGAEHCLALEPALVTMFGSESVAVHHSRPQRKLGVPCTSPSCGVSMGQTLCLHISFLAARADLWQAARVIRGHQKSCFSRLQDTAASDQRHRWACPSAPVYELAKALQNRGSAEQTRLSCFAS